MNDGPRTDRLRALATRIAETVGGIPAVRTLMATLEVYDRAGGGLMAGGLAYSALFALVPGALLAASVIGLFIADPATQERIVEFIARTVPPLEEVVRTALETVAAGAVPTTVIALVGLVWGSSRFYASLDYAFSRVFHGQPRRNEVVRTVRGLLVTFLFVGLPIALLLVGSIASWFVDLAPDAEIVAGIGRTLLQVASPLGSFLLFVLVVSLVYRYVPPERTPVHAFLRPAILVGIALAGFTQLFTFIAPRMVGYAALFGALVAVFGLLLWMQISFNLLLLGASWSRVRAVANAQPGAPAALDAPDGGGEGPSTGSAPTSGSAPSGASESRD
ncbi:MAG TPA: YihY/virulence factor BrkB family protein [Candidatus Limnocylindrales bacterium]|nr:YihY/virulence factor BrkB family protein [Candidatus Limnocylindrales bacterium]